MKMIPFLSDQSARLQTSSANMLSLREIYIPYFLCYTTLMAHHYLTQAWKVLALFLIPIGGGIPAGVLKAKEFGLHWPITMIIYFISDVILALVFEPVMLIFVSLAKRHSRLQKIGQLLKEAVIKSTERYGKKSGVFPLIGISFGVDPMTGRTVAMAAGHKFLTGWMIAITGDMFYFALIMISTLWLNAIIGNETITMLIILALMFILPNLISKKRP